MVLIVESYRGTIIQIDNTTLFVKKCRYAADLDKIFKISLAKEVFMQLKVDKAIISRLLLFFVLRH